MRFFFGTPRTRIVRRGQGNSWEFSKTPKPQRPPPLLFSFLFPHSLSLSKKKKPSPPPHPATTTTTTTKQARLQPAQDGRAQARPLPQLPGRGPLPRDGRRPSDPLCARREQRARGGQVHPLGAVVGVQDVRERARRGDRGDGDAGGHADRRGAHPDGRPVCRGE